MLLKDIFPQNAIDLGMLKKVGLKGIVYAYFRSKEKSLYKLSDYIGCMSQANVNYILKNNPDIAPEIVEVCPNSIEPVIIEKDECEIKYIRNKYNIPIDKTIFIYGGNLGKPQGIDFLIKCIRANEDNDKSFFLIVGSGTEYGKLREYFNNEIPKNAKMLKQLPRNEYEILANTCDVGLIFLDRRFTIPNFPSRMLSYMQASMPVLAATDVNTDIGKIIENGNFGYWCDSSDVTQFNQKVKQFFNTELRKQMGDNARKYLEEHYTTKHSYEIIMKHFEERI